MTPSIGDALGKAWDRMVHVLFRPFDLGKWFVLGFCAFLANLLDSGGVGNPNVGGGGDWSSDDGSSELAWLGSDSGSLGEAAVGAGVIALLIAVTVIFVAMIVVLFSWLAGRGQFMFIDGIVKNRAAVREPWHEFRSEGNSLAVARIVIVLAALAVIGVIGGLTAASIWPSIQDVEELTRPLILSVAVPVIVMFFVAVAAAALDAVLMQFVVPIMYARRCTAGVAWETFRSELLPGQWGSVILYLVVNLGVCIAAACVMTLVACITCCIAALPYIGTVILLPVHVFLRSFGLYFVQQFGFEVFPADQPA